MGLFKGEYDEGGEPWVTGADREYMKNFNKNREGNKGMNILWVNFGWGGFIGDELESNMTVNYTKNVKKISNSKSICNCGECNQCDTNSREVTDYRKRFKNVKSKNFPSTNSWEISDEIRDTFYKIFFELLESRYSDNLFIAGRNAVCKIDISVQELMDEFEIAIGEKYDFMVENDKPEKITRFPMQIDQDTCDEINEWYSEMEVKN